MTNLIYLACPYSHQDPLVRAERFAAANRAGAALMRAGAMVFSPISHSHPLALSGLPTSWEWWEKYDREYLAICKAMVILTLEGWQESTGVLAERKIMEDLGRPVYLLNPGEPVGDIAQRLRGV